MDILELITELDDEGLTVYDLEALCKTVDYLGLTLGTKMLNKRVVDTFPGVSSDVFGKITFG